MFKLTTIAFATCALAVISAPALAADVPQRPVPVPHAVMKGWYLRGDHRTTSATAISRSHELFNVLYEGAAAFTDVNNIPCGDFDARRATFGIGLGYRFNNWFRADVTGEYRSKADFSGLDIITIPGDPFPVVPNNYDAKKSEWLALAERLLRHGLLARHFALRRRRRRRGQYRDQRLHAMSASARYPADRRSPMAAITTNGTSPGRSMPAWASRSPSLHAGTRLPLPGPWRRRFRRPHRLRRDQHHRQPDGIRGHHLARCEARRPLHLLVSRRHKIASRGAVRPRPFSFAERCPANASSFDFRRSLR